MSENWAYPTAGGTYVRDDVTGALTRVEPSLPVDPNPPAPEIDEALTSEEAVAEPVAQATGKSRKGTV